jgi:hypothetical protein
MLRNQYPRSLPSTAISLQEVDLSLIVILKCINGDAEYWATSRLTMTLEEAAFNALDAWQIEVHHRGLKQFTGVERAQHRLEVAQRNHIGLAILAFVRLDVHRWKTGISWFEAKTGIIRSAMRHYLAQPSITLASTA